ncbi:MAG: phosphoribosylaminoimidazolesuccinocarboxamide synthase [Patescibacteria group bacterium]|nr:phosphoribosylaminoimidazolesuccinocarboxamide synthase [Patescibacteria group bacterium]
MPKLPSSVVTEPIPGLELINRGKVRDTYALPGHSDKMLVVASDRLSIFDFVLPALVPQKGAILTAMNIFWRKMLGDQFAHDLAAYGEKVDEYLPPELHGKGLMTQATVVRRLEMCDCEAIVRGYLTGSGLKAYNKTQEVCGHRLPPGLQDGDRLPFPIFTPSTKAKEGHDEHITADRVAEKYGARIERASLQLYQAAEQFASEKGIILADTKFEWGLDPETDKLVLADEVLTPDSSRFWDVLAWQKMQKSQFRSSPTSYDKQRVRDWGKTRGIDKRDPCKPEDVEYVHGLEVPAEVIARTTQIYRYIFWRLTGMKLEKFQLYKMSLEEVFSPLVKIEVISGSESDVGQMTSGLAELDNAQKAGEAQYRRHVISCHRNPEELANYAHNLPDDVIVVAGAGMAAALPGVLKALLVKEGKAQIPVIGVAFTGKTEEDNLAARLSIERLPGQPVLLAPDGKAYFGPLGFENACLAALYHEFLPVDPPTNKPALFDLPIP